MRALYISLPLHSWNEVSGSAQQLRSVDRVWGENVLSLASCQVLRNANFAVQCSLLLMVTTRSVRVPALWCHPAGVDGSSVPSFWQLLELSWVINNESFGEIVVDHCAFGVARRRWRVRQQCCTPVSLASMRLWNVVRLGSGVKEDINIMQKNC